MNSPNILVWPHQTLRASAAPVRVFDAQLAGLIATLFATLDGLDEGSGIGLSAPQIGISKRVSVVRVPDDEYGPVAYVNPVVRARSAYGLVQESCLSVPGVVGNVIRATRISVEAFDATGKHFATDLQGMHAVCLLHEIDHLDGKLFIDRLSWFRRWRVKQQLKKLA